MENRASRQAPAAAAKRIVWYMVAWMATTLAACQGSGPVRPCLPKAEFDQLLANPTALEGMSEYEVLGRYGKPKQISMNTRSEKEFIYRLCGDTAQTVYVRIGSTGRVREVYRK